MEQASPPFFLCHLQLQVLWSLFVVKCADLLHVHLTLAAQWHPFHLSGLAMQGLQRHCIIRLHSW